MDNTSSNKEERQNITRYIYIVELEPEGVLAGLVLNILDYLWVYGPNRDQEQVQTYIMALFHILHP